MIPGRENVTVMAIALSALDGCRNGTIDRFEGVRNVTKIDAPAVVHQMFNVSANATVKRRDADDVGVLSPCPTELYFEGDPSAGTKSRIDGHLILVSVVVIWSLAQVMTM